MLLRKTLFWDSKVTDTTRTKERLIETSLKNLNESKSFETNSKFKHFSLTSFSKMVFGVEKFAKKFWD